MRLRILGPLEILDEQGNRIDVSGTKRRVLLATLTVRAGRTVSIPRLIEELWGPAPPANAVNALQAHIGRLRRLLADEPLTTRPTGYTLELTHETDAAEFTRLVAEAQRTPDPAPRLRKALTLWRGQALEGCVAGHICAAEASRLEESRLTAMETLYDTSLRTGRHAEVITELKESTAAFPLRERFYDQLMQALNGAGRRPEALAVYARARTRLIKELGVEPSPTLRARAESIRTCAPPSRTTLTRELADLQSKIDTLVTRQTELLHQLAVKNKPE